MGIISQEVKYQASSANSSQNLIVTPGDYSGAWNKQTGAPTAGHFGQRLRIKWVSVSWDAALSSTAVNHKVELLSGLSTGDGKYDVRLASDDVASQQWWAWSPADSVAGATATTFDLILMPKRSATELSDGLKVTVAAGGAGRTSYLAIYYEVLE